ncbi:acyl-CoA thioesterase [Paraferrimonas sp. SM1919]|uniref:acyl-CoA thioesterase n=1 Tax=Paraferrimonas sp. SM1919 TaxID=2662263 RepID=UPI0013D0F35D|nr:acyl-CoA thioesterase [Paraferrimonas sp. SM1919]
MNNKRELTLRFLAEPGDVNFGGKVHGGAVMKWIDLAAYACASGWSSSYCVTAYVGGIQFQAPLFIGNLVEVEARVIYTGKTSMHLAIDVIGCDPKQCHRVTTSSCIIVMVAVGEDGKPVEVPHWEPITAKDKRLEDMAKKLMEMRKHMQDELKGAAEA